MRRTAPTGVQFSVWFQRVERTPLNGAPCVLNPELAPTPNGA